MKYHILVSALIVLSLSVAASAKTPKKSQRKPASPIVGEYLEATENPQNVCLIRSTTAIEGGVSINICSGTLISPTRVLTAEHCRKTTIGAKVHCGYQGLDSYGSPKFSEAIAVQGEAIALTSSNPEQAKNGADFMIVDLKTESKITPMKYAEDFQKTLDSIFTEDLDSGIFYLKDDVECRMAGYGIDNDTMTGRLHVAKVTQGANYRLYYTRGMEKYGMGYLVFANIDDFPVMKDVNTKQGILKTNHPENGDSGGPLYCKIDDAWTVIGDLRGHSDVILWPMLGTEAFTLYDKISKLPIADRAAAIEALSKK